jgi:hypothetical protein
MSHSQEPSADFPNGDMDFDMEAIFADMSASDVITSATHQVDRIVDRDTNPLLLKRFAVHGGYIIDLADVVFSRDDHDISLGVVGRSDDGLYLVSGGLPKDGFIDMDVSFAWWKDRGTFINQEDKIFSAQMGTAKKNLLVARTLLPYLVEAEPLNMTLEALKILKPPRQNPEP